MIILQILVGAVLAILGAIALFLLFALYSMFYGRSVPAAVPNTRKVACVGDSITYGDFFRRRKRYPEHLGELLGPSHSVRNFGASGHTAQREGDHPYWKHRYFRMSTAFTPDVVIIMLGTNDSKTQNWTGLMRYEHDLRDLIGHYRQLPSRPQIVLSTPPSTFIVKKKRALPWNINGAAIAEMAAAVKRIGADLGLPVADVHLATADQPDLFAFDGIHPGGRGARLIAETIHRALPPPMPSPANRLATAAPHHSATCDV